MLLTRWNSNFGDNVMRKKNRINNVVLKIIGDQNVPTIFFLKLTDLVYCI